LTVTKESALADIKRVAEATDQTVTRRLYREEGTVSERDIDRLFGNFTEFRRQAGLLESRGGSALRTHIARHASVDDIRKLNIDRADYGEKYLRPSNKRFQTVMVASDLHDIEMDPFWRRVFIDTVRRVQPEVICFGGDVFDLPEFGKYSVDPREWNVVGRIQYQHEFFREVREAAPDAQIDLVEGNHEFRLLRHLAEASPALKSILSDLHGFTVSKLLGLDEFGIRYIARGDLAAWNTSGVKAELGKNYVVYHDTLLVDHFPDGIRRGLSGYNGHHHRFEATSFYNHLRGPQTWMQLGCGHRREASYCDAEKWNMGFAINHIDTQTNRVAMSYIPVADFAEVGGLFYMRSDGE
jgi:hypothetical protein